MNVSAGGGAKQDLKGDEGTNLNTEPVPAVLARPILALVRKPIVRRRIDALALVSREQLVDIRNPHRAPDDLADARHEQVTALRVNARVAPIIVLLLHVKGLEFRGEAVQEDGRADDVGHLSLCFLGDVVADRVRDHRRLALSVYDDVAVRVFGLVLDPVLVQPCDGVYIGKTLEWTCWRREGGVELLDQRRGGFVLCKFVHRFANLKVPTRSVKIFPLWVRWCAPSQSFRCDP
jgi:hypothetical protein